MRNSSTEPEPLTISDVNDGRGLHSVYKTNLPKYHLADRTIDVNNEVLLKRIKQNTTAVATRNLYIHNHSKCDLWMVNRDGVITYLFSKVVDNTASYQRSLTPSIDGLDRGASDTGLIYFQVNYAGSTRDRYMGPWEDLIPKESNFANPKEASRNYIRGDDVIHSYKVEDVIHSPNGIYIPIADAVIYSSKEQAERLGHPFCQEFNKVIDLNRFDRYGDHTSAVVSIRAVNNKFPGYVYWTIINNLIYPIVAIESPEEKDGFYCLGFFELDGIPEKNRRYETHYSYEEILLEDNKPFQIYASKAEAVSAINSNDVLRPMIELKAREMELEYKERHDSIKREHEEIKFKHDRDMFELKQAADVAEANFRKAKAEAEEIKLAAKMKHDAIQAERDAALSKVKNYTDIIRVVGGLVGVVLTIAGVKAKM